MDKVLDLRQVDLANLTKQQICSRIHLIQDEQRRLEKEHRNLVRMEAALTQELYDRND